MTRPDPETLRLALEIHQDLSKAVAPATPGTIRASQLRRNRVLLAIGAMGILALVLLVLMHAYPTLTAPAADVPGDRARSALTRLCGAVLGATLYAFWTARNYLRDGTFRPQYYQLYVVRFVLGIITGFILGEIVGGNASLNGVVEDYGPLTIAIVGGFSAEAVVQILQRIADILVAAVRGDGAEQVRSDAEAETRRRLNDAAAEVQDALNETDAEARAEVLRAAIARMRQR